MGNVNEAKKLELRRLSQLLAVMGVRNSELEDLHAGMIPSSKTGDYSDVKVVTPYGEIAWSDLSRISEKEMRSLMLSVERKLEAALLTYESLDANERNAILNFIQSQRSYDRPNFTEAD